MKLQELIEQVREIDPEAAKYIEGPAKELESYNATEGDLLNIRSIFLWSETPQGTKYWGNNIYWIMRGIKGL